MAETGNRASICYKLTCGSTIDGDLAFCPRCGGKMKSSKTVRTLGWVLLVCGIFLAGLLGAIVIAIGPALHSAIAGSNAADDIAFRGDAAAAVAVMRLIWVIIGLGALTAINGLYQIASGRRSRVLSIVTLLIGLGIAVLAVMTVTALPPK